LFTDKFGSIRKKSSINNTWLNIETCLDKNINFGYKAKLTSYLDCSLKNNRDNDLLFTKDA
jgi:hypothetical protein